MTSGQETERVYSYNPGARMGRLQVQVSLSMSVKLNGERPMNLPNSQCTPILHWDTPGGKHRQLLSTHGTEDGVMSSGKRPASAYL